MEFSVTVSETILSLPSVRIEAMTASWLRVELKGFDRIVIAKMLPHSHCCSRRKSWLSNNPVDATCSQLHFRHVGHTTVFETKVQSFVSRLCPGLREIFQGSRKGVRLLHRIFHTLDHLLFGCAIMNVRSTECFKVSDTSTYELSLLVSQSAAIKSKRVIVQFPHVDTVCQWHRVTGYMVH